MITIFDLAGYTPNLFEHKPLNIFGLIDTILSEKSENDWNNPIFHEEPETLKPWLNTITNQQITENCLQLTIQ